MRALIACEFSGTVRNAFREKGHEAYSCDLIDSDDNSEFHIKGDILDILDNNWDIMIAFPPCTYLCSSGIHWNARRPERQKLTNEALEFVRKLLYAPIPKIALENPIGIINTQIRKPDQIIQPYQFGEDASKSTCLWLKNLSLLMPTKYIAPKIINGKKIWSNQTPSGQNKLGPSKDRWKLRSKTYEGIAQCMAATWG